VVWAFPAAHYWHDSATGRAGVNRAGAQARYGTGGRTDKGIKCSHCHIKGEGKIGITTTASPPFINAGGQDKYAPGTRYTITITMTGEHLNAGATINNNNGMAATIENASGQRGGRFIADAGQDTNACPAANPYPTTVPAGKTTFMYGDCHGVLPVANRGLTQWKFDWVAPAAGAGDLTMFVGMVDGNSGEESSLKDDTAERTFPLREGP
jgi:hypothetical protein